MASPTTPLPLLNIPPEFMQLIANLNTAVVRWNALADDAKAALDAIKAAADAGTQAVPLIQADVKEIADAAKNLHGTGPLGTKFSTQS